MSEKKIESEKRRELLMAAGAITAMAAVSPASAGQGHHHHAAKHSGLVAASLKCIETGQSCISHCLLEFKKGNAKMANCAASVQEMLSLCASMSQMASLESKHMKKVAQACIDVCDTCVSECDKHAKEHVACKDCRDACKDCIKEMKKVV